MFEVEPGSLNSIDRDHRQGEATDPETGKAMVDMILDRRADQKGTGRWAAIEATQMLGVHGNHTRLKLRSLPAPLSRWGRRRALAAKAYNPGQHSLRDSDQAKFLADLEQGLLAGEIATQRFAVMEAASQRHGWNIPLAKPPHRLPRACIIRSRSCWTVSPTPSGTAKAATCCWRRLCRTQQARPTAFARSSPRP